MEGDDIDEQKLEVLRSLIPFKTKRDKRSVLEAALAYIQNIHQDTQEIEKELMSQRSETPMLGVEIKETEDGKFVVHISWKKGRGVAGHVQRVIESLDLLVVSSIQVYERNSDEMITTAYFQVKNGVHVTNEELCNLIWIAEAAFGIM